MATSPFSTAFSAKLEDPTAWRFDSELGPTFTPRFFCCTDPNTLGITGGKEPVAIIALSPNPAMEGETVTYTGTSSYDPDGSITDYDWTFEGHTPSSGTATNGTLAWATEGTYTVGLIVTDGTGLRSTPAQAEMVVKAPAFAGFLATSTGVFYTDTSGTIVWTEKATGVHYCVAIDPQTNNQTIDNLTVWRAGSGVVARSTDGGSTWGTITPGTVSNYASDDPAPDAGSIDYRRLLFDGGRVYSAATWQVAGTGDWRSWLLYTDDNGVTWSEM